MNQPNTECYTCNNNNNISSNGGKQQSKKRNSKYSRRPKNTRRFYKQRYNTRMRRVRKSNKRRVKRTIKGGDIVTFQPIQPYSPTNSFGITPNSVFI
jgi:hypothetical protein